MNFPFFIARRYLLAKKSQQAINIISLISIISVTVGATALVVILSAYNGFDTLVKSLYNTFDSDIKITAVEGKTFTVQGNKAFNTIKKNKGVLYVAEVVEENVLLSYGKKQYIGIMKGVSSDFTKMSGIDSMIVDGEFILHNNNRQYAVIGRGVAIYLTVGLHFITPINIYVPKRTKKISVNPERAINRKFIYPSGIFSIQQDFDAQYVIVPIEFARDLLDYTNEVSAVEIKTNSGYDVDKVKQQIQDVLGSDFYVKNRYEQNEALYKIMQSEKWSIILILIFILIIASFNIIGSLTMLIIDKKEDINTLQSLGSNLKSIRTIFLLEGWLISILGALLGLIFGGIVCLLQQRFGFVPLGKEGASLIINSYPIDMQFLDFVMVFFIVSTIGFFAAFFPVRYITKKYMTDLYLVAKH